MATHSSILARKVPLTEESGGLQSTGHKESDMTEATEHTYKIILIQPHLEDKGVECNLW